jgi:Periplasmic copper-binding protein (NosD)
VKKSASVLAFLCVVSLVTFFPGKADVRAQIIVTIDANGNVLPSSAPIQQTGSTYTLASSITGYAGHVGYINVERSNITFDGNGYAISGLLVNHVSNLTVKNFVVRDGVQFDPSPFGLFAGIYVNDGLKVTVANNTITGISNFVASFGNYETVVGIIVKGGSLNVISGNNLVDNFQGMEFNETAHNLITGNNITCSASFQQDKGYHNPAGVFFDNSSDNVIHHNNFEISIGEQAGNSYGDSINNWDYGSFGNYWMDYNGTDNNGDGIGDTPYHIGGNNADNYPSMRPISRSNNPTPTPTSSPTATPEPTLPISEDPIFGLYNNLILAGIIVTVFIGLMVYLKKRHPKTGEKT